MDIGPDKKEIVSDPVKVPIPNREPITVPEPSPVPVEPIKEPVKV